MATVTVRSQSGSDRGTVDLDEATFGIEPNVPVMHQVVVAQLAARRAGTQSTKTRAEVSGGGAKPFKQKGTGRARQGSTRSPQWRGGGVALGPKPRSYEQRTPKKMKRHGFKGQKASHGAHRIHRAPGSIGACATPSRVFKGTRMAGRMGAERVTTLNLQVVSADAERNLLIVRGAVPGPRGGLVVVRNAVKASVASSGKGA